MSGGFNPVNMISQVALAAVTGGASIVAQIAMQVVSQIAQEVIQSVGQQLGLPQGIIDAAKTTFQGALAGGVGGAVAGAVSGGLSSNGMLRQIAEDNGASPVETAQFEGSADGVREALNQQIQSGDFENIKRSSGSGGGKGGAGWIMAMAEALGKQLNGMAEDMESLAGQISKDTPDLTTKFSALSQQFSILFNAASTAIKSVGEGMAQAARKS